MEGWMDGFRDWKSLPLVWMDCVVERTKVCAVAGGRHFCCTKLPAWRDAASGFGVADGVLR
jgi:hypothetical protein